MGFEKYMDDSQPYGLTEEIRLVVLEEVVKGLSEKLKRVLPEDEFKEFHRGIMAKALATAFEYAQADGGET